MGRLTLGALGLTAAVVSGLAVLGCESLPPALDSKAPPGRHGLLPLRHSGFARAWVREGASFAHYRRIRSGYSDLSYRRPPGSDRGPLAGSGGDNYSLPPEMTIELQQFLRQTFQAEFTRGGNWTSTTENGPDVLVIRITVGDLVVHAPLDTLAGDDLMWLDSVGEVTILIELFDSQSQLLIARVLERGAFASDEWRATRATVGQTTYEAHRLLRSWAERLRALLDQLKSADVVS